ncbi:hypothetical protein A2477_01020 [Candidatus Falkowbacteria bacterium RIFOXYC2_FULL_47_12]|uniref:Uncharacterized protein n=2 Tax=Candidatus Falkowiibacteriota TaxID=1752728 RepID=A0A1F5TSD3_9BACT|nr:MAG: hypothetical protein A2242_01980 [Candidatus Falkowbacteria bacterium RIFOXYA2_FULL_47_9]OGF41749.1 MAG: hypothetical protein A2477_01020 [Candidatus Falkowbacteria bacterium RIFOXYC2_FULL_47_12]
MTTIVKATSKGQITIPMSWRKQFDTNQFILKCQGDTITLQPIDLETIIKRDEKKGDKVIFNAVRDNKGKGISAEELLKVLKKIDG